MLSISDIWIIRDKWSKLLSLVTLITCLSTCRFDFFSQRNDNLQSEKNHIMSENDIVRVLIIHNNDNDMMFFFGTFVAHTLYEIRSKWKGWWMKLVSAGNFFWRNFVLIFECRTVNSIKIFHLWWIHVRFSNIIQCGTASNR